MVVVGELVSRESARRVALRAQGFGVGRAGRGDVRQLRRVVGRVGVLQVDSVNVLCRSHYLPVFSRVGEYRRETLDRMAWGGEPELFEGFWGHKASLLPVSSYPLVRWRMRAAEGQVWGGGGALKEGVAVPWAVVVGMERLQKERPGLVGEVLARIADEGAMTAGEVGAGEVRRKRGDPDPDPSTGSMWNWQDAKIAVEYLFATGQVMVAGRRNFERVYDLTERVLPEPVLRAPELSAEAQRELVRISARSLGVATARELCGKTGGHYPLPAATAKRVVNELVESGDLIPANVEGVTKQSYLSSTAEDRPVDARALLSPFDTLIWNRDRTEHLFDFFYRISIYTPAAQRIHGYYVLPFLLGDRLVARVDLKADRKTSTLLVPTITPEPGAPDFTEPLVAELQLMASWLGLERVRLP
ncbi:winged helix DNA-binding domain-containing protein [Kribbella sp. NBC_00382]|uniref:winged helix-turn-helix domain-containing protein n=1 Tax=Kribbella sp. NBC_00382 TaxID=2975967 RepID=UPI002E24CC15